ncbi:MULTISPECIES: DUF2846 domain-containing protein [unclassified Pseudomonas]|uniref:DUF2846 domain-containing protein n=1 Tax=unclassified Pseudomonas TaxID=196821 RepID=UPI0019DEE767|nr:DUF2846 domain-containing protein [Pseudomonas sp.]MBF0675724.1 DUF2846 domain-containing protein [Pseudomonas sp.]
MSRPLLIFLVLLLGGCASRGAFFAPTNGTLYHPRENTPTEALIFVYRPKSAWANQELEAPGLFLDNRHVGNLPSDSYLLLRAEPGTYKLEVRRPLFGLYWTLLAESPFDFTHVASFMLDTEAGRSYYLRYDELNPPPSHPDQVNRGDVPLQLVGERLYGWEVLFTNQAQPERNVALSVEHERPQRGFWRRVGEVLDKIGI